MRRSRPAPRLLSRHDSESDAALMAVTPIDGRYRSKTRVLAGYWSEFALVRHRVRVEIEWYLSLAANTKFDALGPLAPDATRRLRALSVNFSLADAIRVKNLEAVANHDVKAVEYFLKEKVAALGLPPEIVHFACTSEDINNLAYALLIRDFTADVLQPRLATIAATLGEFAHRWRSAAMIARTHGQPASPTTMGKEFAIFATRLNRQLAQLAAQEYLGKANGAVGNFNAHQAACPEVDWIEHSRSFVESLGLVWNPLTTQIESHDFLAELFDTVVRVNTILLGLARDIWSYIGIGYLSQRAVRGEVGSSTMPHKVNPIDFENCEGNLGIASALFQHLATKLPISRWQRDLSDSTAFRSIGTAFGHEIVALATLEKGLSKIDINPARIAADLDDERSSEVVTEAIQTVMRRYGIAGGYEKLKELTRGREIDRAVIREFCESLALPALVKKRLAALTPRGYVGLAAELADRFVSSSPKTQVRTRIAAKV